MKLTRVCFECAQGNASAEPAPSSGFGNSNPCPMCKVPTPDLHGFWYDIKVPVVDANQVESAVAPGECGSVPDERAVFEAHIRSTTESVPPNNTWFLERSEAVPDMYCNQRYDDMWKGWQARAALGMQPPNQPNSDHVAVIGAKPDSVHLAVTSAEPESSLTAAQITEIASWLDEASDDIDSWGGYAPDYFADKWDLAGAIQSYKDRASKVRELLAAQSGISSLVGRPNEKTFADKTGTFADTSNCFVVQTEQPSLRDALDLYEAQTEALPLGYDIPERGSSAYNWQTAVIRDIRALLAAQRQDSDKDAERWRAMREFCTSFVVDNWTNFPLNNDALVDAAIANGAPK